MSFFRRIRSLFRRNQLDRDMAEEMRFHLEERTDDHVDDGMRPDEARAAAHRKFGGVAQIQERTRDLRGIVWLEQLGQDLRYAVRQLRRSPGFTAVVVVTLALGIGATTAIYSVIDTLILNPIPGPGADRLLQIGERMVYGDGALVMGVSPPVMLALESNKELFEESAWHDSAQLIRQEGRFTERIFGQAVSPNFFSMLGGQPSLGRTFVSEDAVPLGSGNIPETDGSIVLSHSWWLSQFGGNPDTLGTTITMSDRQLTIVDVMPRHFQFPRHAQFWMAAEPKRPSPQSLGNNNTKLLVRPKRDVDIRQVQTMLDAVAKRLMNDYPANDRSYGHFWRASQSRPGGLSLAALRLKDAIQGRTYTVGFDRMHATLFGLLGAIGFVLAIVCANIANLSLARTERRQQEIAVRAAIGASRGRLVRQFLTENMLLACFGGLAGLLVARWGMNLLVTFNTLPRVRPVDIDGTVLTLVLLVSVLTGLVFGGAPTLRAACSRISDAFKVSGNATASVGRNLYRNLLVIAQVTLALVLLIGAGLMIQSVIRLLHVNPGFDSENLLSAWVDLPKRLPRGEQARIELRDRINAQYAEIRDRFAALPGVTAVGYSDHYSTRGFWLDDPEDKIELQLGSTGIGEADFARAMRIPLLKGRYLNQSDVGENIRTVVVNETMSELLWPGGDPLGKTFRQSGRDGDLVYEVVGVLGDAKLFRYEEIVPPTFYRPMRTFSVGMGGLAGGVRFAVRTESDPRLLISAIRNQLQKIAAGMEIPTIQIFEDVFYDSTRTQRTYRNYLVILATNGLLLAALGIYGVLAYSVARRTKEIGIRMAIGAQRRHVLQLVMRDGARLILAGIVLGLFASFWLTRYLQSQLFEVSPTDPVVLASVVAVLGSVAFLACYLPARRATKVDPVIALRAE